jgi:hypothetical protein
MRCCGACTSPAGPLWCRDVAAHAKDACRQCRCSSGSGPMPSSSPTSPSSWLQTYDHSSPAPRLSQPQVTPMRILARKKRSCQHYALAQVHAMQHTPCCCSCVPPAYQPTHPPPLKLRHPQPHTPDHSSSGPPPPPLSKLPPPLPHTHTQLSLSANRHAHTLLL